MFRLGRYLKQDIHIQTLFRSLSCTEYTRKIHLTESPSFWWKRRWSLTIGVPKVAKLLFCISKTINYNWQWLLILKIIDEIVDCITYKNQLVEYLTLFFIDAIGWLFWFAFVNLEISVNRWWNIAIKWLVRTRHWTIELMSILNWHRSTRWYIFYHFVGVNSEFENI